MNAFHTYFGNVIANGIKSIQAYFTLFLLTSTCSTMTETRSPDISYTNIDVAACCVKITSISSQRTISTLSAVWIVSIDVNCIIGVNIEPVTVNLCKYNNLYHCDAWLPGNGA